MILDHAFALPRDVAAAHDGSALVDATLEAADVFSSRLVEAGFAPGSSRPHPGQGTTNRRCFLDDLMIECLLVDDESALNDPRGTALDLPTRFGGPRASGVGFGFRPDPDAPGELPAPTFDAVAYRPAYLPAHLRIDVAAGLDPGSPLLFHLPFARRGSEAVPDDGEPRDHPNGARRVRALHLESVAPVPDAVRRTLSAAGVRLAAGAAAECLHVRLDGMAPGAALDLRPLFPLRLYA